MRSSALAAKMRLLAPEFIRFAFVGGAATLVHAAVYTAIVSWTALHPQIANALGFLSAVGISVLGHHHFTFREASGKRDLADSSWRLGVAAIFGYLLNALFVYVVSDVLAAGPRLAILPMIFVTPVATFALNRSWVFYDRKSAGSDAVLKADARAANTLPSLLAVLSFSCVVGLTVFLLFGGQYMIMPTNTAWMMHYDPSQHYMGWAYFRDTPLFQFPLGANPLFGDKIASSIVFSDSLPLFALPFKLANAWLPRPFQYFGIWIALCFCLQTFFAFRILRQLGMPPEVAGLGGILIALSPAMLWRLDGHEALIGQWVLLAGVSLCLDKRWRGGAWLLLLAVTTLIHAYLFVMVAGIWVADVAGRSLGWHGEGSPTLREIVAPIVICPLIAWSVGYFMVAPRTDISARDGGFGFYHAELQTFFDSNVLWSYMLPDMPNGLGANEGLGFLGLGGCALLILAIAVHIWRKQFPKPTPAVRALFLITVAFALYAFSNRIAIVNETIASIPLPHVLDPFLVAFRVSGRFIWLASHLILLTLVVFAFHWAGRRIGTIILAVAVVGQFLDLQPAMAYYRQKLSTPWENPAQSNFWKEAAHKYRRLAFAPASPQNPNYLPMAMFAAENGLAINVAYLARHDDAKMAAEQNETLSSVENGTLAPDTLYVVWGDGKLFETAVANKPADTFAGQVDGFSVLAPGWSGCTDSCGAIAADPTR
ncbi:MAG: DUF6311 domain-containing protein [Rhizobiaceae bacterium]